MEGRVPRLFARSCALICLAGLVVAACGTGSSGDRGADDPAESTDQPTAVSVASGRLDVVQERGSLNCGVNDTIPGFGIVNPDGDNQGFDVDFCRVVAAAVLGDAEAVNYVALDSSTRFPTLQSGQIDVLIRNTT